MDSDDGINKDNSILAENPKGDMMIINVDLILRDGAYFSKESKGWSGYRGDGRELARLLFSFAADARYDGRRDEAVNVNQGSSAVKKEKIKGSSSSDRASQKIVS